MATATIGFNTPNLAAQTPWWRRRDPCVLVPLIAVHAAIVGPAAGHLNGWLVGGLLVGVLVAQCLLLGIWAALGCLPLLVRWALVSGAFLLGLSSLAVAFRHTLDFRSDVLMFGLIGACLVTVFAALLLPLRGLLSWRLDFDPLRHPPLVGRRGQIGFMSIAAFSLAIAAPLAIVRLLGESGPDIDARWLVEMATIPLFIGISACLAAYALLAWPLPQAIVGSIVCFALVGLSHIVMDVWISKLSFFKNEPASSDAWQELAALHAGVAACIIPTFAALRLGGLKLFALCHVDRAFADPRHPRPLCRLPLSCREQPDSRRDINRDCQIGASQDE